MGIAFSDGRYNAVIGGGVGDTGLLCMKDDMPCLVQTHFSAYAGKSGLFWSLLNGERETSKVPRLKLQH